MKTTYNERYKGKPFLRMLEFYFLDVIGHLDSTSRKFIQETEVKFCSVYGLEGDWKTVIRSVMEFPPHLDSVVLARWRLLEGKPVTPQEFVEQLIDSNWNTQRFQISGQRLISYGHHMNLSVGQAKAVMKRLVPGYNPNTAPAILVPESGHTVRGHYGVVSRSTSGFQNARQLLARDIRELRRVYGPQGLPNSSIEQLIQMNHEKYPTAFTK